MSPSVKAEAAVIGDGFRLRSGASAAVASGSLCGTNHQTSCSRQQPVAGRLPTVAGNRLQGIGGSQPGRITPAQTGQAASSVLAMADVGRQRQSVQRLNR